MEHINVRIVIKKLFKMKMNNRRGEGMSNSKEINQALKVTLVFAVITSVFNVLGKIGTLIPVGDNKINIAHFLKVNMTWFIIAILIIIMLFVYIIKADGKFNLIFIYDPAIRLTSGFLIIFEGIINLSNKISVFILNIQSFHQTTSFLGENADEIVSSTLTLNIIQIIIYLFQIMFGLFFVLNKRQGSKKNGSC